MKKLIKLLAAITVIYFITAAALPKLMPAAAPETNSRNEKPYFISTHSAAA